MNLSLEQSLQLTQRQTLWCECSVCGQTDYSRAMAVKLGGISCAEVVLFGHKKYVVCCCCHSPVDPPFSTKYVRKWNKRFRLLEVKALQERNK